MDKLKGAFDKVANKLQTQSFLDNERKYDTAQNGNARKGRIAWPPKLIRSPHVLGEVTDLSGRQYPQDIGRSVQLGGRTYYMFGDTFCFDDAGEFRGVTNNSVAVIPDVKNPTKSKYIRCEAKVKEFVPFSDEELAFCENPDNKAQNRRIVNWAFGGLIHVPSARGREGWVFYDQVETHGATPVKQNGIGLAKARSSSTDEGIVCERVTSFPFFDGSGPLWGNISNISAPDGWTYLLSGIGSENGLDNYMARIRTDADFTNKSNYQYLKKGGEWVSTYNPPYGPFGELSHDVLAGQGQGAIVYIPEHAPHGKPYLWIGCEKFPTSQFCMGVAARPEGPWEVHRLGEMPKFTKEAKTRYCIYPHIWGSEPEKGRILITWSDDGTMGGKVVAAMFEFHIA
ncbi:hypothetical protein DM02DRAFT_610790 [Periconia macrospinosa]|uniref:DUF4185 domain-containing protein n=1 Tax=Periconia macrospinosa TaxID=97972 RepID=A0A2V1E4W2_9PLEO|nr:hypothetical protein DM02DRAFT_610790 [Periconia macrospinosa]